MIYLIIALSIGLVATMLLLGKPAARLLSEKWAIPKIEDALFSSGERNKTEVLEIIHKLTNNRISDDLAMDYFYKIKGLQVLNSYDHMSFWVKHYLASPTKIRLNYFEQVKFYEAFLNYPKLNNNLNSKDKRYNERSRMGQLGAAVEANLGKKLVSHKLA